MRSVAGIAIATVVLMCQLGCGLLRGKADFTHKAAQRVLPLGGAVSSPPNRHIQVRFLEIRPDGKAGRFQVQSERESYKGWAAEGESFGSFAGPLVGESGVVLTKLTPREATLMFQWAK